MIAEPTTPTGRVGRELDRVLTRLAALGPARSARPGPDGTTPADRVRPLLQHLADAAADAEGGPRRPVPALAAHALGDQLAVLAADLLAAVPADDPALAEAADELTALRRAL